MNDVQFDSLMTEIGAIAIMIVIATFAVFLIIYTIKDNIEKGKFVKSLNEHDKSVIADYFHTRYNPFRKKCNSKK